MTEIMGSAAHPLDDMLERIRRRIDILDLRLNDLEVVTEAATGAYASTAVIAALAGANVHACARDTRNHGTAKDAIEATRELARRAGVASQITFSLGVPAHALGRCDILTNSGRIRPITPGMIWMLPQRAVIALMFEAWEFRGTDLDLGACRDRGIRIAAVNERHADIAVFPFLGPLCVRLLDDADMPVAGKRIAVLCDNPFAGYLVDGLAAAGGNAVLFGEPSSMPHGNWDIVVLALLPKDEPMQHQALEAIAARAPRALLAQFWGDVDRKAAEHLHLAIWPPIEPGRGHMGILLNRLGAEPIVRLQAGGLKAAEIVRRAGPLEPDGVASLL